MRILADENIHSLVISLLTNAGHDVVWARETNPGDDDATLLAQATRQRRLLITHDKDFGDLVHRQGTPAPSGILLFRLNDEIPPEVGVQLIFRNITAWDSWHSGLWTGRYATSLAQPD